MELTEFFYADPFIAGTVVFYFYFIMEVPVV